MISKLRNYIEEQLEISVHFCYITQVEDFPTASISQTRYESVHDIQKARGIKTTDFELMIYDYDYLNLESLADLFDETFNGKEIRIEDLICIFLIEDIQDDCYPSADGSDNWIYSKTITCQARYRRI